MPTRTQAAGGLLLAIATLEIGVDKLTDNQETIRPDEAVVSRLWRVREEWNMSR
jgi:hypothetical protein